MRVLFIQGFHIDGKGGGAYIIKRLFHTANNYGITPILAYDAIDHGTQNQNDFQSFEFKTKNKKFRYGLGRLIGFLIILGFDFKAKKTLKKIIEVSNADMVHLIAHGVSFPISAYAAISAKKPYVIAVHDLWHLTVFGYIPKYWSDYIFKKIVLNAKHVYVISEGMGKYLVEEFGIKKYIVVHDGIIDHQPKVHINQTEENDINILYVGMLHSMQVKILNLFIQALLEIPSKQFKIHICSNFCYEPGLKSNNVDIINYGWVSEEKLKDIGQICDFGFLPLSFEKRDNLFYRTSLMTKIPTYVKLNVPIICIGPSNSSAFEVINNDGIGFTIDTSDLEQIKLKLTDYFSQSPKEQTKVIDNIHTSACNRFDLNNIADRFFNSIIDLKV
jgi:glycosyltransferase involved in cell wall biosynthesis